MYRWQCASCHPGEDCAPPLIGEAFWAVWKDRSVGPLYEKIRLTMPRGAEGFFSRQEYADVVSYLLSANNLPAGQTALPTDLATLNGIVIRQESPQD